LDKLIEARVSERVQTFTQQTLDATLDGIMGDDWQEAVRSDTYKEWIEKQDAQTKALQDSSSVRDAAALIRKFKAHRDAPSTRKQQLAAGVSPKGTGGFAPAPSENPFAEGFKTGRA
jgi:hypothetical protein